VRSSAAASIYLNRRTAALCSATPPVIAIDVEYRTNERYGFQFKNLLFSCAAPLVLITALNGHQSIL
jgi:hypothetical protein